MDSPIYLDHATTTRPSDHLISELSPFFKRHWQCPTAPYLKGKEPFAMINHCHEKILETLGGREKDTFVFTSCAAEGIAQIYQGIALDEVTENGKNHFVTIGTEDASFLMGMKRLEPLGIQTKIAPLNSQGTLTPESLEKTLSPRTSLVSISWANGLTGVIHPIAEIAHLCKEKNIYLHVDVSDVLGKLTFKFEDLPIDFLTFDGDRIHAPKGSGGLLIRYPNQLSALIPDGTHQNGHRGGTLNLPAMKGLSIAFEELEDQFDHLCMEIPRLRDHFESVVKSGFTDAEILFQSSFRLPNVSLMAFPGISNELLAYHLSEAGVFASIGGGRHQNLESLLLSMGVDPVLARSALSFSLGRDTNEEEIKRAAGLLVDVAARCKTFSEKVSL